MSSIPLTDSVSAAGGPGQQELSSREVLVRIVGPEIIPFDAAGSGDDDPDDLPPIPPTPAAPAAVGMPCIRPRQDTRFAQGYTVCAVKIVPNPDYPDNDSEPDLVDEGQALSFHDRRPNAEACCELYSYLPRELPPLGVRPTHLVVNDWRGRELFRRPIQQVA